MKPSENDYNFSLFRPVSPYGKKNRNLIITLLVIWFVAIFGFQLLLVLLQKPTPEKSLLSFESVWGNVKDLNASDQQKMDFVNSLVAVAGKSSVKPEHRIVLDNALTWSVFNMVSESEKVTLSQLIRELGTIKEKLPKATDNEYIQMQSDLLRIKSAINSIANEKTGIDPSNNKASILPYNLNAEYKELSTEDIEALPKIMKLYLTHNQSFLTDTKIFGFPFHYFYTAEFLLIMFVCMCLFYSIRITQLQKKYSIKEG